MKLNKTIAVCKNPKVPCSFRRWSVVHRSKWMLPFCKWDGTCNFKYETAIAHTSDDRIVKGLRVHVSKKLKVARVQPIW